MLFSSYGFIFVFLPVSVLAFHLVNNRLGVRGGIAVLVGASLAFYALWDLHDLFLLLGSILFNQTLGRIIERQRMAGRDIAAGRLLVLGVSGNLLLLCAFKYTGFLASSLNGVLGTGLTVPAILLPLGISFFTFEQLAYLIDVRRGAAAERSLARYALFVAFFPRLVAGPVLRYAEIASQLPRSGAFRVNATDFAVGMTIFTIGLAKKSLLADSIAPYANLAFADVAAGGSPDLLTAWGAALSYTLQLYFDFSGYSDMAIGAARCFGLRFPANFNSPYKATSIIEFWRRWHITLSRFLRDYVYVGLGGNRRGAVRRFANLFLTMLIGGLWHGANWTFVAWGALHGVYLILNHALVGWLRGYPRLSAAVLSRPGRLLSWAVTMLAVIVGWVLFRSPDFAAAGRMMAGMAGIHGIAIPAGLLDHAPALQAFGFTPSDASGSRFIALWMWCLFLSGVALLAPNSQQILAGAEPVLEDIRVAAGAPRWRMDARWRLGMAVLFLAGLLSLSRGGEFLYWQF